MQLGLRSLTVLKLDSFLLQQLTHFAFKRYVNSIKCIDLDDFILLLEPVLSQQYYFIKTLKAHTHVHT